MSGRAVTTGHGTLLAIDFGTTFTVAAARSGSRAGLVEIEGRKRTPSVVYVDDDGSLVVGHVADQLALSRPERAIRSPKSLLGARTPLVVGGRAITAVEVVAAVLRSVVDAATRQMGAIDTVVLTHPAMWADTRRADLAAAAEMAGLSRVELLAEPVAGALAPVGAPIAVGETVAVYDLGGGTFDAAVVARTAAGFDVVGRPVGDDRIGGDLFDELIVDHFGDQLDPEVWAALQFSDDPTWQRAAAGLHAEAQRVKELLSVRQTADLGLSLPTGSVALTLTRAGFEALAGPHIDATVDQLRECIAAVGTVDAIHLMGGGSEIPLVTQRIAAAFPGVRLAHAGDPKAALALGATAASVTNAGGASNAFHGAGPEAVVTHLVDGPLAPPLAGSLRRGRYLVAAGVLAVLGLAAATLLAVSNGDDTASALGGAGSSKDGAGSSKDGSTTSLAGSGTGPTSPPSVGGGRAPTTGPTGSTDRIVAATTPVSDGGPGGVTQPTGTTPTGAVGGSGPGGGAATSTTSRRPGEAPVTTAGGGPAPTVAATVTTQTTAPQATTTTGPRIVAPGPLSYLYSRDAAAKCLTCAAEVVFDAGPPENDGGGPVSKLLLRRTDTYRGEPLGAPVVQEIPVGFQFSAQTPTPDGPDRYILWEVAAVNAAGAGPYTTASVSVPNLVGMNKLPALQMAAVMGLVPSPQSSFSIFCTAVGTVCSQSIDAGTVVAAGTAITVDIRA